MVALGERTGDRESELQARTGKENHLDIQEVVHPELDAQLVAENIALQLEKPPFGAVCEIS